MTRPKRVYWDACVWIAYIKQEVVAVGGKQENRHDMCRPVLLEAEKGNIEIVTSAFTLAEVCKSPEVKESQVDHLPSFFDKSYILLVPVDKVVGQKAQAMQLAGMTGLKPADAVHLASAYVAKCAEFHTFDDTLIKMSQQIIGSDGTPLTIDKPAEQTPAGALLKAMTDGKNV
jgi:predicted nucleic acid-binding protein